MSVARLADLAEVDRGNLSRFERGKANMRNDAIERLAAALGLKVWQLYYIAESGEDGDTRRRLLEVMERITDSQRVSLIRLFGDEVDEQAQ